MAEEFTTVRGRDAGHVFRGFVYQISLTIRDWLELDGDKVLELERGEDIDLVCREITNGSPVERLLQQVKHSERPLSLRSGQAASFLANAYEHAQNNPSQSLLFRFLSNAPCTYERNSPIEGGKPGIQVWEELRTTEPSAGPLRSLTELRLLLRSISRPPKLNPITWEGFVRFLKSGTDDAFHDFVRSISWSMKERDVDALKGSILASLQKRADISLEQAEYQYRRLFFKVCDTLKSDGVKRLSRGDLQAELSSAPSEFPSVSGLIDAVTKRVEAMETRLDQQESALEEMSAVVFPMEGIPETALDPSFKIDLDPPQLGSRVAPRAKLIQDLMKGIKDSTWVALDGEWGSGKRHIALLLAQALGGCGAWIRLGENQDAARIQHAQRALFSDRTKNAIVLEDLPPVRGDDELSDAVIKLAEECKRRQVRLISTSISRLPSVLARRFPAILSRTIPECTVEEVIELFKTRSAPASAYSTAPMVHLLTRGNAALVSAVIDYLGSKSWAVTSETLNEMLKGDYALELRERTTRILIETIPNDHSRNLLYRLTLCATTFSEAEVNALSQAPPPLNHPQEHLTSLLGVCITRKEKGFQLSRLAKEVGSRNLSRETLAACHLALAKELMRVPLDQLTVVLAVGHLMSADQPDFAGRVYGTALSKLLHEPDSLDDFGLSQMWSSTPLPQMMNEKTRLLIRGIQCAVGLKRKQDIAYVTADLKAIVAGSSRESSLEAMGACMMAGPLSMYATYRQTREFMQLALSLPQPTTRQATFLKFRRKAMAEPVWVAAYKTGSAVERSQWLEDLAGFDSEDVKAVFGSAPALDGCLIFAEQVRLDVVQGKISADDGLSELRKIESAGGKLSPLLEASAVCAALTILCEAKRIDEAIQVATGASERFKGLSRFLICHALTVQLVRRKSELALTWVEVALSIPEGPAHLRVECLIMLAIVKGGAAPESAVESTKEALQLARTLDSQTLAKAACEHAIALWRAKRIPEAYVPMTVSSRALLDSKDRTNSWKALFAIHGHISGFLAGVANGAPPQAPQGAEEFAAPIQGTLLWFNIEAEKYFKEDTVPLLPAQLAMFAEAIGLDEDVNQWSLEGLRLARQKGDERILKMVSYGAINAMGSLGEYNEIVNLAHDAAKALVSLDGRLDIQSVEARRTLGIYCRRLLLVPGVMRVMHFRLLDPTNTSHAQALLGALDGLKGEPPLSEEWLPFVEGLRESTVEVKPWREQADRGKALGELGDAAQAVRYLGATLEENIPIETAVRLQHACLGFIARTCNPQTASWRQVVVPFFSTYWQQAFNRRKFLFSAPSAFEPVLKAAGDEPPENRPQRTLSVVAGNLGVSLKALSTK